ncbi:MAG: zf-HC2 domain-containing protein [Candidatus Krumholzibacteriota bacterium]|nr:zf-HC2 domain-containing protein [Candidatus Krumholzibacteriota bacterium]
MDRERIRRLMMAHMDGELDDAERRELEEALAASPELRAELARLEDLGRRLSGVRLRDPADDVLEELDRTLAKRAGLPLGWLLVVAGTLVLLVWSLGAWLLDPALPALLRWAGGAVLLGLLLLFLVKARERWIEYRRDPYRDVVR